MGARAVIGAGPPGFALASVSVAVGSSPLRLRTHMIMADNARHRFLEDYRHIRHAEGRGSEKSDYYLALPSCERNDPNAAMWDIRSKTYSYFVSNVLEPLEAQITRPLDVLDLGAGNCWLS